MPCPAEGVFKRKNSEIPQRRFLNFGAQRGSGGYALCKPIFSSFRLEKLGEMEACGRPQAVLAILVQTARREFAEAMSQAEMLAFPFGECPTVLRQQNLRVVRA